MSLLNPNVQKKIPVILKNVEEINQSVHYRYLDYTLSACAHTVNETSVYDISIDV